MAVTQETAFQVGNGISFQQKSTKRRLGKDFDTVLYKAVRATLVQGTVFGFFNLDHIEVFKLTEFVPLLDEENGALMAGVRFWQISADKPLRFTLFEVDGYTDYTRGSDGVAKVLRGKRPYKEIVRFSVVDGVEIYDGGNYPSFPIVPLYANLDRQSALVGMREQIDCYDLIKSGFANDLDDASMIYWTLTNTGGMDDVDLAKFIERMKVVRAAVVDGDDGARAEAHTINVPYESRKEYLTILRKDMYRDLMMLDVDSIAAGAVTATQIRAAYEPLNEKCKELGMCIKSFIAGVLDLIGVEDTFEFDLSMISNQTEQTNMVLAAAEYLDEETVLRKLPFLTADEIEGILKRKDAEEMERFKVEPQGNEPFGNNEQLEE